MEMKMNKEEDQGGQGKFKKGLLIVYYFVYCYFPITLYMICLYVTAISRESLGIFTVIMVAMIHPLVSLSIGFFASCIHKLFHFCLRTTSMESVKNNPGLMSFSRLANLSFNVYLSLIACLMFYLFRLSVAYREKADLILSAFNDFTGTIFNKCTCPSGDPRSECANNDDNVQNYLTHIPTEFLFLMFIFVPLGLHVFHSLFINQTIHMTDVIFSGNVPENVLLPQSSHEMEDVEEPSFGPTNEPQQDAQPEVIVEPSATTGRITKKEWLGLFVGTIILVVLPSIPLFFDYLFTKSVWQPSKYFLTSKKQHQSEWIFLPYR